MYAGLKESASGSFILFRNCIHSRRDNPGFHHPQGVCPQSSEEEAWGNFPAALTTTTAATSVTPTAAASPKTETAPGAPTTTNDMDLRELMESDENFEPSMVEQSIIVDVAK